MAVSCPHCRGPIEHDGSFSGMLVACPHCGGQLWMPGGQPLTALPPLGSGAPVNSPSAKRSHSVVIAVLLNFCCIFGLGQLYNGQAIKGIVMILVSMVCAVITHGVSILVTFPVGVIDAGMIAARIQRGERVSDWQWF